VATVNESGIVTGHKLGTAQIAASAEGKFGIANIDVSPPPVARVAIAPPAVTLDRGGSSTLTASAFDDGGAPITGRSVTWASGNTNVATVDAGGTVTALGPGTADITATIGGVAGHATVTVLAPPAPVASVTIAPKQITIESGQTTQLTATVRDKEGNVLTGRTITWTTTNQLVVNVDGNGNITGFFPGTANIVASCERITGTATVRVR
jgi:trimeric autotransporter adhesin